jgi:Fe-S oxidoreductase
METVKGERFSDIRVKQAVQAGAKVLVTACPYCITLFEDSRLTLDDSEALHVKDITEIVQQALGL